MPTFRLTTRRTDRRGTTAIEYTLIASLVAVAIVVALTNLGAVVEVLYALVAALAVI